MVPPLISNRPRVVLFLALGLFLTVLGVGLLVSVYEPQPVADSPSKLDGGPVTGEPAAVPAVQPEVAPPAALTRVEALVARIPHKRLLVVCAVGLVVFLVAVGVAVHFLQAEALRRDMANERARLDLEQQNRQAEEQRLADLNKRIEEETRARELEISRRPWTRQMALMANLFLCAALAPLMLRYGDPWGTARFVKLFFGLLCLVLVISFNVPPSDADPALAVIGPLACGAGLFLGLAFLPEPVSETIVPVLTFWVKPPLGKDYLPPIWVGICFAIGLTLTISSAVLVNVL